MRIGVIGSGEVGRTLASGLKKHGYEVRIGSRSPAKLAEYSKSSGVTAATFADVAAWGEAAVLAVGGEVAEQALRDAYENAHAKAEALAQETGGQLGELLRIEENGQAPQPVPYFDSAAMRTAGTPIERGTQSVQANVTVTFSLG